MSVREVEVVLDGAQSNIIWVEHSLDCCEFASLFRSDLRGKVNVFQHYESHKLTIVTNNSGSGRVVDENGRWRKVCEAMDLADGDEELTFWST